MTDISCVAIGNGGYVVVTDSNTCTYHGIPSDASAYLDKQHRKYIDYIAIGPDDQYYIEKTNGKCAWYGPEDFLDTMMESTATAVELVSFGPWGIWYVPHIVYLIFILS